MTPVTDKKPAPKILRICTALDPRIGFVLIDDTGTILNMDANPKRLADWGLEHGQADFVRHDYSIVEYEASR